MTGHDYAALAVLVYSLAVALWVRHTMRGER